MPYQRALAHRLGFEPGSPDYETTALPTALSRLCHSVCVTGLWSSQFQEYSYLYNISVYQLIFSDEDPARLEEDYQEEEYQEEEWEEEEELTLEDRMKKFHCAVSLIFTRTLITFCIDHQPCFNVFTPPPPPPFPF